MRILILSCNTGGGHNSAAAALRSCFLNHGVECDLHDALLFVSKPHSDVISNGHTYVYRYFPRLFGVGYRFEEKHPPRFLYEQMSLGAKKFTAFLKENAYDAVVCTHIFGNMLVTEARRKFGIDIPHFVVTTDYAMHPGTDMVDAQRYFVAAEQVCQQLIDAGVPSDRVMASGIPISSAYFHIPSKAVARRSLGLPASGKLVLLIGGSIGCGRLHKVAPKLVHRLPKDTSLVIICGHNEKIYKKLKMACIERTVVVGYTDRVAEYMAAADLCLTKPGGLSTTEAFAIGLPMVLMLSVPGCETRNMAFFEEQGVAVGTDNWDEAIRLTGQLIADDNRLSDMHNKLVALQYPGGAEVIVSAVLSDLMSDQENTDD